MYLYPGQPCAPQKALRKKGRRDMGGDRRSLSPSPAGAKKDARLSSSHLTRALWWRFTCGTAFMTTPYEVGAVIARV